MQYYDINTSPSGRARVLASGRYFLYYEGSAGGADSALLIHTNANAVNVETFANFEFFEDPI